MRNSEEQTNFWHDATLDNLEWLQATYVTHSFVPHIHEGYASGVIEQQFRARSRSVA